MVTNSNTIILHKEEKALSRNQNKELIGFLDNMSKECEYRNLGIIDLGGEFIYDKNLMSQFFSQNSIIVLDVIHDTFAKQVKYKIQWDSLPEIQEGYIIPTYVVTCRQLNGKDREFFINIGDKEVKLASDKSGLVVRLSDSVWDTKVYFDGKEIKGLTKVEVTAGINENSNITEAIIHAIPDKVIGNGITNVKQRKIVLDKRKKNE